MSRSILPVLVFFITAAVLSGAVNAQASLQNFTNWVPVIAVAILAGAMIAVVYYVLAYLLNNRRAKAAAVTEFGQVFGTALAVLIIIAVMYMYANVSQQLIPMSVLSSFCSAFGGDQLSIISGAPTSNVCNSYSNAAANVGGAGPDYGLEASYIILARLTSQDVANLNALYIFQSYLGFLEKFSPTVGVCAPEEPPGCISEVTQLWSVEVASMPYSGYALLRNVARPLEGEAIVSYYSFVLQLIIVLLMLLAWPFLLAAGLILRVTIFGRRVGGLLIALAVGSVIIYPFMVTFEYVTLTSPSISPIGLGTQAIPNPAAGQTTAVPAPDQVNFFSFAYAQSVIYDNHCWPIGGSVPLMELTYGATYLLGFTNLFSLLASGIGGFFDSLPSLPAFLPSSAQCTPQNAINALLALVNVYGIMIVSSYLLPLLNVIITLSAVKGISGLLGGDTELAGIGKLV